MTVHQSIDVPRVHQPYMFTERDYVLLSKHGAFDQLAKAELIEGVIVAVSAQYSGHVRVQTNLFRALADACDLLGDDLGAWIDGSIAVDGHSMPQPDIFVSRGLPEQGPVTLDLVALVVEIADTTVKFDLRDKVAVYAAAGIPEYWVADVNAKVIHQMWSPQGDTYAERREVAFGKRIEAVTIASLEVETGGLA